MRNVLHPALRARILACAGMAAAACGVVAQDAGANDTSSDRVEISIPYPNAGMYLYRGIYGSFAGGRSRDDAGDEGLYQWQGEVGYFYTDWISGGFGFRINAGEPSDSLQTVENRYFLLARFHKAWPTGAGFLEARLGVDDVSFSLRSADTLDLREPLEETNAGLGFTAGLGWKFSRYLALTMGQRLGFSLVAQNVDNPHRAMNFVTQPGLALDVLRLRPAMGQNVKALYLLTELQFGQSLPERGTWVQSFAWITGVSMAF